MMRFLSFAPCSSSPRLLCHARNFPAVHRSTILLPPPLPPPLTPCWLSPRPAPVLRVHLLDRGPHPTATGSYSNRFVACAGALLRDAGATAVVFAGSYGLVLTFDTLTHGKLIQQSLSRKMVHILSGLLFAACWPVFRYPFSSFHLKLEEIEFFVCQLEVFLNQCRF
uniref:Uncharacterized protein MANES_07G093100 n=1 Tax=Rhizophora mucronata TaxID=61149 RepID=A0A2P2JCZ4_RHIMU